MDRSGSSRRTALLVLSLRSCALLFYGNLRGIREAGRTFAFPLYFFITMAGLVIVVCVLREITGHLPMTDVSKLHGIYDPQGQRLLRGRDRPRAASRRSRTVARR